MTTYILGAGAAYHAGYPLCSELWPRMVLWVVESQPHDSEYRQAINTVSLLHGPVSDVEAMFTDLDSRQGVFRALTVDQRNKLSGSIRCCLRDFFKSIGHQTKSAEQYTALAERLRAGDAVITFNYDLSFEIELIRAGKFRVRDGYGFEADWEEPHSDIKVLKLHGSINWIGVIFGGRTQGTSVFTNSLGTRPFVDNVESVFPGYPAGVLDKTFPGGGITGGETTLILPTYEKQYFVTTSVGDEWISFYESLWSQAGDCLQQSDRIVIIGYSMPDADHRARALLLWSSNRRAEVFLCCAASNSKLKREFQEHGFGRVRDLGSFETHFN